MEKGPMKKQKPLEAKIKLHIEVSALAFAELETEAPAQQLRV